MANTISKNSIVHPDAKLGDGNYIGPFCIIHKDVEIGDNNVFSSYVSIGSTPEHKTEMADPKGVVIGSGNVFREFTTINSGTKHPTKIGNDGFFMRNTHFGHDCEIHDFVTIACNAIIGGHVIVMPYANIGLGAIIHQNQIIAPLTMIGMGTIVTKKSIIEMAQTYVGNPARKLKENKIGIERSKLNTQQLKDLEAEWISQMVTRRMEK